LERSPVATFIIDRSHRVVRNFACQKMTGIESKDLRKRVCENFRMDDRELADGR
jgi:hypothetical protein